MYVHSTEHRAVHSLSKRYDLTNTGYKFLEIGINVGSPNYVEITLENHRGHELSLFLETWKSLYEQRWNIYKMLTKRIQGQFYKCWIANRQNLYAERCYARTSWFFVHTMIEMTLRCMFDFDGCIDITFKWLDQIVDTVDDQVYAILQQIASEDAITFSMDNSSIASYWL